MRDYAIETTFDVKFSTRRFSTGAPFALASGAISAYPDNSVTQLTAGITLTADFDGVTGLNNVRVVATVANGYAAGSNYALVITTGTVDSVSVVGEVIAEFSLGAQSFLRPTVAGRTLDVSSTGEAGVDWANVGSPTTTVGLSGTTVKTATDVETDTQDIQARLPAALVGGRIDANVGAISTDATAADNAEAFFDGTGYAGTGNTIPTVTTVGTLTTYTANTPQTGDAFARLGAPAGASVSVDIAAIEAQTDDIGAAGAGLTAVPWNAAWDAEVQSEVDDALVARFLDKLVSVSGTADSGSTTTMVDAARTEGDNDYWKGQIIVFTSGTIAGQARIITDFVAATDTFTFAPAVTQAVGTQTYVIVPAVSVWDDVLAEHLAAGSTGNALNAAGSAGDPWATALPGAYGAGTAGKIVGDNVDATISSRASQASVDIIDDFLDTEVAAIKTKTDSLTFTVANQVDSNVLDWKSAVAPAMTGDAFARLGAPAGASVSADVAAVKVDTAAILVDTGTTLDAALAVVDANVDAILVDTAEIGVAGAGLTNINLPNQTMDIVGNITGNLSGSVGSVTGAVGSVTGAVGSVTGNVGGNVVGTVASVVGAVGSVTGLTASDVGAIKAKTDNLPVAVKKNTALAAFEFLMVDATDFATPETGIAVTATRSLDGAAFGACANAVTEVSNGIYKIDLAAGDLNATVVTLRFTGAGCADRFVTICTQT